ncbi:MAG: smpB [Acidimicrobiia bacterium]|nr:smpB [Acidimicrobiia bacterium]
MRPTGTKSIASNRRARHDFDITDSLECGIALQGSEVKSLREAKVQIADSFARIENGEAWVYGIHISPYSHAFGVGAHDPDRARKLLMHKSEVEKLGSRVALERVSLVPLRLYFVDGRAKLELGIGKGRKQEDRRQAMKERDAKKEMDRALGRAAKGMV